MIVWAVLLVALFRYGVGELWGSGNDLGVIAAPVLAAFGALALSYLAVLMVRDLRKKFEEEAGDGHDADAQVRYSTLDLSALSI